MKILIVSVLALLSFKLLAIDEEKLFVDAYKAYKQNKFDVVLELLEPVSLPGKVERRVRAYLMGLSYNRVEEFSNAIKSFDEARNLGADQRDIDYEIGQASYAMNDLERSKIHFINSYNLGFKKDPSLYYLGHISQLLDQNKQAKSYFLELAKNTDADKNLRQISTFQLAEVIFEKFKDSNYLVKKVLNQYVLPLLTEAYEIDPESKLAEEIKVRKETILRQYKMDVIILANGREISKDRFSLNFGLLEKYDNNVTYATDDASASSVTKMSSLITTTDFSASYNFIPNKSLVLTPSVSGTYVMHHENDPLVYTNDYYETSAGLTSSFEHTLFDAPASTILDVNYSYQAKDYLAEEQLKFFQEEYEVSLGEKFRFLKSGDTVINGLYRYKKGYTVDNDTVTYGGNFTQTTLIMNKHYLTTYLSTEFETADNSLNESTVYTFNGNYYIPAFYKRLDLSIGYTLMMMNTELKGSEMSHTPSIDFTQNLGKYFDLKVKFEYTKNMADSSAYTYSKYVASFGINYSY